jgi:hypothetical protein
VKPSRTLYRNRSTALDPPACTAGSAAGLQQIKYKPRGAFDLEFQIEKKKATIAVPVGPLRAMLVGPLRAMLVGPLRATLVLGKTQAAGDAGHCGVSAAVPCTSGGATLRCR